MYHFPTLWEEDPLLFDDSSERTMLIREFDEMFGKQQPNLSIDIAHPSGRNESNSFANIFTCDMAGYHGEDGNNMTQINPNLFLSSGDTVSASSLGDLLRPPQHPHPSPTRGWCDSTPSNDDSSCISSRFTPHQKEPSLQNHLPGNSSSKVITIIKLPDGNLYMSPGPEDLNEHQSVGDDSTTLQPPREPSSSRKLPCNIGTCAPSNTSSSSVQQSPKRKMNQRSGGLTPRQLFPPDKPSSWQQTNSTTPSKVGYIVQTPRGKPDLSNLPANIFKNLEVIRTHRRSSYADGDSLVEVQPATLPGSPTMFAYQDAEGAIRVPMDIQSNQKALAVYRSMTPTTTPIKKCVRTSIGSPCAVSKPAGVIPNGTFPPKYSYTKSTEDVTKSHSPKASKNTICEVRENHVKTEKANDRIKAIIDEWKRLQDTL
ncbi:uncharacterized protein [Diadema setosum]|uniref:uncharacterized protein isoform X2 n=1 Tax=Diadema setosum TaxID=31175 RepID=UPI003B3A6D04